MSAPLYRWPAAAKFGRVVPKSKFYEHSTIPATVRDKFVSEVHRIIWAYKLADETINLRGDESVPEIQVFSIEVKADDVSEDVLTVIDRAVPFPIIFEISRPTGSTRMVASHKQLDAASPRLSAYFTTEWHAPDAQRAPLPPSLDLAGLYAGLLTPILPMATRPGENMVAATDRLRQASKLERDVAALEKKLRTEPQFNRKVELRRQLRAKTAELALLIDTATPITEDTPWTNC
ncbi:DUF4391 domain-containing protein (plasmid) [Arthrobacter sp. UC242_113]|uniref:DUF4391 domain-containing protein n=1 Tax=Arthrobacter sp. UC242_113 TaxID=3374550 RepID=UPI00375758E2